MNLDVVTHGSLNPFAVESRVYFKMRTRVIIVKVEVLSTQWACKPSRHLRCDRNRFVAVLRRI